MDYILKINADIVNKGSRISKKQAELDISCNLTIDEIKTVINEHDVRVGIAQELYEKHKVMAINVEVYDVLEKMN